MLKIGNVSLKNNIILAPMAGVSTSSYRNIWFRASSMFSMYGND